ncbi:hypothetical protein IA57_04880 [Mangrovimonas yunxiaonensis]|uniref:Tetrapyrrole biosynthesis uroporphyrinogen III synthase domain-containing protein n=1 Tax=Mangrovimonas yunxiaonensis TaxID=1197477 RepID=A0A084TKD4_9FLAO|nr:uroporphyrinogen-III synthase [Mangrovimonas yunxiaonensis]KFB01170.1 hypothetical protein IA57_04880 [Mangrovimonas yunxiaonensis]GGH38259.1 uroporphyrinogen III methyltransferase [Mangrovimonas yunxiaonensis]
MKVLSTKILTKEQKNLFQKANIALAEYDAINIKALDFDDDIIAHNAIITSQNTVKALLEKKIVIKHCFCVGEKTKALLEEHGQHVTKMTHYGADLAKHLVKNYKNEHFWLFCSSIRRDELPNALTKNNISFKEVHVYKTVLNPQTIAAPVDAVLFFSPSGVESYITNNTLEHKTVFCIGNTTADAVKPYAKDIYIAKKPTIESVIQHVIKQLGNKHKHKTE